MLHREQAWADAHGLVVRVFDRSWWNPPGTILLVFTAREHDAASRSSTGTPPRCHGVVARVFHGRFTTAQVQGMKNSWCIPS